MSEASWQFRTAEGVVTVRSDAIGIQSTPGQFLAGQLAHWRHGNRWDRGRVAYRVFGILFTFLSFHRLAAVFETGLAVQTVMAVLPLVALAYGFWRKRLKERTIPRGAIRNVTLDGDGRELTFTHDTPDGLLSLFRNEETGTSLSLPAADDVREAEQILTLRSIEFERPADEVETETEHRFATRHGACFCGRCDRQVSPNDRRCPHCEYALRIERPRETDRGRRRELDAEAN